MKKLFSSEAPVSKSDWLNKDQYPNNDIEFKSIVNKPYASLVWSLMHAQVATKLDIAFAINILRRYQSNQGL